jgi:hypothetical protein
MRSRVPLFALTAPLLAIGLSASLFADQQQQQQQPPPQQGTPPPTVQVGVPAGRGAAGTIANPAGRGRGPAAPAPRSTAGRVLLGGATTKQKGVWLPGAGGGQDTGDATPLQPWAQGVLASRRTFQLEPHTRCKPSGGIRQFLTPYGVEFVELPEMQRIYIFDIGGPHTYRTVYMDGRTHPATVKPSYYGHSIGWWEDDTLVVDTTGFNESFWIDRRGTPHTEKLRLNERFTRLDAVTMKYEVTFDDPGSMTQPWKTGFNLRWEEGTELFEYVCQQSNYAPTLMIGGEGSTIDRTSPIVP